MELIRPEAEFVIKSSLAAKTDKKYTQSLYINICSHPAVASPSLDSKGDKKQWSVPYFVGKIRYDQEDGGEVVNTVDVVFNKESTDLAKKHPEYSRVVGFASESSARPLLMRLRRLSSSAKSWSTATTPCLQA
jgi:hypothetical protein